LASKLERREVKRFLRKSFLLFRQSRNQRGCSPESIQIGVQIALQSFSGMSRDATGHFANNSGIKDFAGRTVSEAVKSLGTKGSAGTPLWLTDQLIN
jgi:hypothetical protein